MDELFSKQYNFSTDDIFHDWIYINRSDYDIKAVKEFNRWLRDNKYQYVELYHGTSVNNLEGIDVNGIKKTTAKRRNSYQSESGYVYLSIYKESAKMFGKMASPQTDIVVLKVRVLINKLMPDKDQLNNKRHYGNMSELNNTLADSLIYVSGARVNFNIPAADIIEKEIWKI